MEELCDSWVETNHDYDACVVISSTRHDPDALSREIMTVGEGAGLAIPRHDGLPRLEVLLTSNATFGLDET
jgi:hypothetical protein